MRLWRRRHLRRRTDPKLSPRSSRPALWDPISAVAFPELGTFVTADVLRRFLGAGTPVELVYAGDRMWPALRHGQRFQVERLSGSEVTRGSLLCVSTPFVDVLRLDEARDSQLILQGDADPAHRVAVETKDVLGRVPGVPRRLSNTTRRARRAVLSLVESFRGGRLAEREPEELIRARYDSQAPFYGDPLDGDEHFPVSLLAPLLPAGARILVAGAGTGRECIRLARAGFAVTGVDFSPRMTERARRAAQALDLPIELKLGDLRSHDEQPASFQCVFLGGGFYSFIASAAERVSMLRRSGRWLTPDGVLVLSGRTAGGIGDRARLAILFARGLAKRPWGDAHARWITADGDIGRSFLHIFTRRQMLAEARAAGLAVHSELPGHLVLCDEAFPKAR